MSYRAMRALKCSALNPIDKVLLLLLLLLWTACHDQMTMHGIEWIERRIGHEYKIRLMVRIAIVINRCSVFYSLSSVAGSQRGRMHSRFSSCMRGKTCLNFIFASFSRRFTIFFLLFYAISKIPDQQRITEIFFSNFILQNWPLRTSKTTNYASTNYFVRHYRHTPDRLSCPRPVDDSIDEIELLDSIDQTQTTLCSNAIEQNREVKGKKLYLGWKPSAVTASDERTKSTSIMNFLRS